MVVYVLMDATAWLKFCAACSMSACMYALCVYIYMYVCVYIYINI
jgi:hypothetical protein